MHTFYTAFACTRLCVTILLCCDGVMFDWRSEGCNDPASSTTPIINNGVQNELASH